MKSIKMIEGVVDDSDLTLGMGGEKKQHMKEIMTKIRKSGVSHRITEVNLV